MHSVVGRRETAKKGVEYLVRWVGFSSTYDKWLQRRYLDTIVPLVMLYDENKGFAMAPVPRAERTADEPLPAPAPAAVKAPRFRHRVHSNEAAPADENPQTVQLPDGSELAQTLGTPEADNEETKAAEADLSDRFPVGTRVDVHYPLENQWWTGVVVHSWVYRPRTSTNSPERRIFVKYEDKWGTIEHGLNNSIVKQHKERSQRLHTARAAAPPKDDATGRRIARITRQLT